MGRQPWQNKTTKRGRALPYLVLQLLFTAQYPGSFLCLAGSRPSPLSAWCTCVLSRVSSAPLRSKHAGMQTLKLKKRKKKARRQSLPWKTKETRWADKRKLLKLQDIQSALLHGTYTVNVNKNTSCVLTRASETFSFCCGLCLQPPKEPWFPCLWRMIGVMIFWWGTLPLDQASQHPACDLNVTSQTQHSHGKELWEL